MTAAATALGGVAVRVIPCLDVKGGRVVKGVNFLDLQDAGDPVELAARYYEQGADELTFLDVGATVENRATMYDTVTRTAEQVFIPLTVGGGVRSVDDVSRLQQCGADKIGVNSAAIARPDLVGEIADRFGAQAVVLSLDVKRSDRTAVRLRGHHARRPHRDGPRRDRLGARGRRARRGGAARQLHRRRRHEERVRPRTRGRGAPVARVPVIASGGAGRVEHFAPAVDAGADAVLAASVFHRGEMTVGDVKAALRATGHAVR